MATGEKTGTAGLSGTQVPELLSEAGVLPGFVDWLISIQAKRDFLGWDTGWTHLNRVINGLTPGLFILGGGPGSGKTTYLLQLAWQVAELNHVPVIYYSLDQAVDDLRIRTVSRVLNIENRDLFRGRLDPAGAEVKQLAGLVSSLRGEELFIDNEDGILGAADYMYFADRGRPFSVERVERDVRQALEAHEAEKCLIVVDYLQRIVLEGSTGTDYAKINTIVGQLSSLAGKLESPVIAISELNRASYGEKTLAGFKDSGRLEYAADVCGVLPREREPGNFPRKVELHILKNRNGERATIKYDFWLGGSEFVERQKIDFIDDEEVFPNQLAVPKKR